MKAEALTDATIDLPNARIVVDLPDGQRATTTGFVIRDNERGEPIIVLKAGKLTQKKK